MVSHDRHAHRLRNAFVSHQPIRAAPRVMYKQIRKARPHARLMKRFADRHHGLAVVNKYFLHVRPRRPVDLPLFAQRRLHDAGDDGHHALIMILGLAKQDLLHREIDVFPLQPQPLAFATAHAKRAGRERLQMAGQLRIELLCKLFFRDVPLADIVLLALHREVRQSRQQLRPTLRQILHGRAQ